MKKQTIIKYLKYLSNLALNLLDESPSSEDLQKIQIEHLHFIKQLKENYLIDRSFIWELEEIDLGSDIKTAEVKRGLFAPVLAYLQYYLVGEIISGIGEEMVRMKLGDYHQRLVEIADKYNYQFTVC